MTKLNNQVFKHWDFTEIEVISEEKLPVRIYYYTKPERRLIEFYIVELHGADIPEGKNSWEIEEWDIEHSDIVIIGEGSFNHKGFRLQIDSDNSTGCKTFETIFKNLQKIESNIFKLKS